MNFTTMSSGVGLLHPGRMAVVTRTSTAIKHHALKRLILLCIKSLLSFFNIGMR